MKHTHYPTLFYLTSTLMLVLGTYNVEAFVCKGDDYLSDETISGATYPSVEIVSETLEVAVGESLLLTANAVVDTQNGGQASFYWCALEGNLEPVSSDFSSVNFIAPFQQGKVKLAVHLKDGLGYVDIKTFFINVIANNAECHLYAVHDEGRNHSLFFTIDVLNNFDVKLLGTMYHEHDIESLAIHPTTNQLFAAAGKDGLDPGYLYTVNANTGAISPIGDTGFRDINGLSFKPDEGTLWGWAKGEGLIQIDPATAQGTLQAHYNGAIEDITWNNAGSILYAVRDNRFLAYDTHTVTVLNCTVQGGEIEAIEMMPSQADNELLFSMHNDNSLTIRSLNVDSCEQAQVTISTALENINLNDVEGIALPKAACIP
ncbi:MAG: hypothetical protein VSS75_020910 [Candidatus Parabeggiatoa sp.]|nr:hypothetical protein [Candidatus Parabeggiatoa sp.]